MCATLRFVNALFLISSVAKWRLFFCLCRDIKIPEYSTVSAIAEKEDRHKVDIHVIFNTSLVYDAGSPLDET